ncbi:hypothetical protein TrVFT333_005016 [Trichoderma virens FT-333]|nr:hypothetical protein TrVFT333_005016 [Trichoderma virens FT-333]
MDTPLDDEAMAQAMGFSSFGAQDRSQKKRKYNPHADAIVGSDSATAQRAARPSATGSNSTPLGLPNRKPDHAAANADEIGLDEDENEGDDDGVVSDPTGMPERPGESPAPALVRPPGLPDRPPPGIGIGFVGSSRGRQGSHGAQDGSRRTVEWEGYYDPSSNENPWRRLEESRGLQSLGTWIPRGHQASASS